MSVEGVNTGTHTTFFDRGGTPVRNEAHHTVRETHTNRSVEFRGHFTSTYVYATDTQTFTGAFLFANEPMSGTLLQETGLAGRSVEVHVAGKHDILDRPYDPFCAALDA